MCIRDSVYECLLILDTTKVAGDVAGIDKQLRAIMEKHGACLLYTSDAADERSSVDLGGRRIIKKKNKEEHKCHRLYVKKTTKCHDVQKRTYTDKE